MTTDSSTSPLADPSVPSEDGTCHFFRLSGELRNTIYGFLFHEAEGLRYIAVGKGLGKLYPQGQQTTETEANQIKYTCRQLRQETRSLAIRYCKDLYFDSPRDAATVLRGYPISGHHYLQSIHVTDVSMLGKILRKTHLRSACDFCDRNPDITVFIRKSWLDASSSSFLAHVRKELAISGGFIHDPVELQMILQCFAEKDREFGITPILRCPENLRFMPKDEVFNEQGFRDAVQATQHTRILANDQIQDGMNRWVELARKIHEYGV
jgi:hypothetical protein